MLHSFSKALLPSIAVGVGLAIASVGIIVSPAQAFTLSFDSSSQSSNSPATGASARVDFDFVQAGNNVLLNLDIFNSTGQFPAFGSGATEATLVGIAFDLADSVKSFVYDDLDSNYSKLFSQVSLPPFGGTFDVGIRSAESETGNGKGKGGNGNDSFAGGNPQMGLTAGKSTKTQFVLSGNNLVAAALEQTFWSGFQNGTMRFASRFQQVNAGGGSDKLLGGTIKEDYKLPDDTIYPGAGSGTNTGNTGNTGGSNNGDGNTDDNNDGGDDSVTVPEPTAIAGMGLIASVITVSRRRKQS
jgi:hypothetical protein